MKKKNKTLIINACKNIYQQSFIENNKKIIEQLNLKSVHDFSKIVPLNIENVFLQLKQMKFLGYFAM